MSSPLKAYFERSLKVLTSNTSKVLKMDINPMRPPLTLYSFSAAQPPLAKLEDFALGSDSDIGGTSKCSLEPDAAQRFVAFKGHLSTDVQPEYATRVRGGYVAFRNKSLTSLFGELSWDLSLYSHLRITLGEYKGDERWRSRWFCNLQTDGPVRSDLYQHRLHLGPVNSNLVPSHTSNAEIPQTQTIHIPLSSFVLTNSGQASPSQLPMMRSKVRTVGFSLLAQDGSSSEAAPVAPKASASPVKKSGYHELIAEMDEEMERGLERPQARTEVAERDDEPIVPAGDGSFELPIYTVEAVNWDPEAEDGQ